MGRDLLYRFQITAWCVDQLQRLHLFAALRVVAQLVYLPFQKAANSHIIT